MAIALATASIIPAAFEVIPPSEVPKFLSPSPVPPDNAALMLLIAAPIAENAVDNEAIAPESLKPDQI